MKFTIEKSYLANAMSHAVRAMSTKSTLSILKDVFIEAGEGKVQFLCTDLDVTVRRYCPADTDIPGEICTPAAKLNEVIGKLSSGPVTFRLDGTQLVVSSGKSKFNLPTGKVSEMPPCPKVVAVDPVMVDGALFVSALSGVLHAAAHETIRSVLCGVHCKGENGGMDVVTTDTHRLALVRLDGSQFSTIDCIIPVKSVSLIAVMGKGMKGDLTVRSGKSQIQFESEDFCLSTRIIDGSFPQYQRVIPKDPKRRIELPREDLIGVIQRALLVSGDEGISKGGKVYMDVSDDAISVSSESESGSFAEDVPAKVDGAAVKVSFNGKLICDFYSERNGETAILEIAEYLNPIKCTTSDPADGLGVVMPMSK